MTELIRN